jgi:uncharacterized protein (DUF427 family)
MQNVIARGRSDLRHEPIGQRVRANTGGSTVVDSTRAILVWEPRRIVPSYAVPAKDIHAELSAAPATNREVPAMLHPGIPFGVHTAPGEPVTIGDRVGAGFRLADEDLDGYVVLDFDAFEDWFEEDERIAGHPRDPFHRVDVRQSSRPVRIEIDGEVVAETTRARMLFETGLPVRYYMPREDVRLALHASEHRSFCPYKGEASYWSVDIGGHRHENLGWSYEHPLPDGPPVAGLVSFWNEIVDVFLDGEPRERPGGPFAQVLRDEFGVG